MRISDWSSDVCSSDLISAFVIVSFVVMIIGLILFICFMERAQRRLLVQYPKRASARGMMQADRSHLPLKLNTAAVIPQLFASPLLLPPLTISQFAGNSSEQLRAGNERARPVIT